MRPVAAVPGLHRAASHGRCRSNGLSLFTNLQLPQSIQQERKKRLSLLPACRLRTMSSAQTVCSVNKKLNPALLTNPGTSDCKPTEFYQKYQHRGEYMFNSDAE